MATETSSVQTFDVTIGAAVRVHGVDYSHLKARTCPKWAMHGVFDFMGPGNRADLRHHGGREGALQDALSGARESGAPRGAARSRRCA